MSGLVADGTAFKLSRTAVVSLGVTALLIGFVIAPIFPFVVAGVCGWWLYDDLARDPSSRPGWLGLVSLAVFTLVAIVATTIVTVLATNADCGSNVFGGVEDGPSSFDQACADAQRWRSVVAVSLTLVVCAMATIGVRRSDADQAPAALSVRTFGISAVVIAVINYALVGV